jgi:hypothetical protein
MKAFSYERATTPAQAVAAAARTPGARFIAGGTNLLDLMKLEIETPASPEPSVSTPCSRSPTGRRAPPAPM